MTISCDWRLTSQSFIDNIENPSLMDLLAMERNISRGEMAGTDLGKRIRSARLKMERCVKRASAQLEEMEITEDDLRALVELRLSKRLIPTGADENNNSGGISVTSFASSEVIACPHCEHLALRQRVRLLRIGGVTRWSDGGMSCFPKSTLFTRCSSCNNVYWLEDATISIRVQTAPSPRANVGVF